MKIKAEDLDKIFDEGKEDITKYLDFSKAKRRKLTLTKKGSKKEPKKV